MPRLADRFVDELTRVRQLRKSGKLDEATMILSGLGREMVAADLLTLDELDVPHILDHCGGADDYDANKVTAAARIFYEQGRLLEALNQNPERSYRKGFLLFEYARAKDGTGRLLKPHKEIIPWLEERLNAGVNT